MCDVPVTSVDLFPTICEATGKPLPPDVVIDGLSLAPLLRGERTLRRTSIFWHYPHYWNDHPPHSIVRHGDWKMIRRYQGKRHELFDLAKDPREKNDLSRQMRAKLAELDEELDDWLEKTGAALPEQRF